MILRHMVNGHTDEAIAARLGMSTRSVANHMRWAAELFGSRSRAQLAYLIAKSDFLDDVPERRRDMPDGGDTASTSPGRHVRCARSTIPVWPSLGRRTAQTGWFPVAPRWAHVPGHDPGGPCPVSSLVCPVPCSSYGAGPHVMARSRRPPRRKSARRKEYGS
ncbi:helix-turn-helix transcriptional regulator [Streptomyces sp. NPDC058067]|uniref:helix-turn-helix transcriptional regulator n=1 Tax=Streptomyces sp. NPDC058067 TaxID=3346324 RepID=UPI0036E053C4